jgi:anti-sigma factor (TIGR02949 family)
VGRSHNDVEAHFKMCERCYPHLHMEERYRDVVRRACASETAPSDLRTRVLDLVSGGRPDA